MDYFRDVQNVGSSIWDIVNDAVERNDYSNLAKNITQEVAKFTRMSVNGGDGNRKYTYTNKGGYRPIDIDLGTKKDQQKQYSHQQQQRQRQQKQYQQSRPNQQYQQGRPNQQYQQYQQGGPNQQYRQGNQGTYSNYNTSGRSQFWGQGYDAGQGGNQRTGYGSTNYNQGRPQGAPGTVNPATGRAITPFNQYKKNAGSGLVKQSAGVAGLFVTVPAVITSAMAAAATGGLSAIITAAVFGAGAGVSGYFTSKGSKQRKLSKIFDKYSKIVGSAEYMTIEDLAEKSGETPEMVAKNLDEMIAIGMLPQLKFDKKKTTMMLTKNAYDQYLLAESSRKEREAQEAELDEKAGSAEARKVITEGENFVAKIKAANDKIPGQEMSDKLDQMERIVSKIFAQVRKEPSSAGDLRKFMNYYLPTTEKLLNAYIDLDKQPEVGENITKTKKEIEETVDTINNAFENLLDSLFQEVAWDISSDISVMKTMMEQDGLMKKGMPEPQVAAAATAAADVVSEIPDIKDVVDFTSTNDAADEALTEPKAETQQKVPEPEVELQQKVEELAQEDSTDKIPEPELKFGEE